MPKLLILVAALFGAFGVGLSAYVAHGVSDERTYKALYSAAQFSLFNALAILALIAVAQAFSFPKLYWSAYGIALGGLLFQAGVVLSVMSLPFRIPIAPVGGVIIIIAWLSVAVIALTRL